MKFAIVSGILLGASSAIALPKKEPSFKPDSEDAAQSYIAAAIEPAANKRCTDWSLEKTEKNTYYPTCDNWELDISQQDDYVLVGTRLIHGRCGHWEVIVQDNKIISHCTDVKLHESSNKIIDTLPKLDLAHETRDAKKEPSFKPDFPPSLTYVDTAIEQAGDKKCGTWSLDQNEQKVLWPKCDLWVYEPAGHQDYVLVGTKITSGRCEKWTIRTPSNQVIPECEKPHTAEKAVLQDRQAESQSEDPSDPEGNAVFSDQKRDAIP
ncbi:hypothetical protein Slin14017_G036630 [Septoria linicola]|nr:hypothetical protein Slin14017_G036630 [Septoria linicola]